MNASISVNPGQFVAWGFSGRDAEGQPAPIHGTIVLSDPAKAFLFRFPEGVDIVAKSAAPAGGSIMVTATLQAFSADGTALAAQSLDVTFNGPPPPPQAVEVVGGAIPVNPGNTDYGVPVDPGMDSITF